MKKVVFIIICSVLLISILIINLNSSHPIFKMILMSEENGKVYFNNHDIDETVRMGNDYLNKGNAKKAYIVYDYVLKNDSDNIKAYFGLADMYARVRNFKESKRYFNEIEKRLDDNTPKEILVQVYYTGGLIYDGDFIYSGYDVIDKAIKYYKEALNVEGLDEKIKKQYDSVLYYKLGVLYADKDMNESAIEYFKKSIDSDPNNIELNYALGVLSIEEHNFKDAYDNLMKYKKEKGENNSYFLAMGYYYTEKEEYDKALEYLNSAEDEDIVSYIYNFMHGNYYEKIGEVEKAKEYYTKAMKSSLVAFRYIKNKRIIERFKIDIEDIKRQNEEERERNYNTFINISRK